MSKAETVKVRLYHDSYDNEVDSYTNGTYTTLKTSGSGSVSTGRSIYHDRTFGGSIELESLRIKSNTLRLVSHYKVDKHKELDANDTLNARFKDTLVSFSAEDNIRLDPSLILSLGGSRHQMHPNTVFSLGNPYSLPDNKTAYDVQAGLFYDWSDAARFYATIAKKTRLPTLKDRYSQRLGTFIENPALRPEESINYEIGYQGKPWPGAKAEAALFYSDISDKIQSVANVSGNRSQMQNVGEVHMTGVELGVSSQIVSWLELGSNYTYIKLKNISAPTTKLTDVPRHKFTAFALARPVERLELVAFVEHNSSRWASNTLELSGFTTLDLKADYELIAGLKVAAGVTNVTDENYTLAEGFPNPGRMWYADIIYQF